MFWPLSNSANFIGGCYDVNAVIFRHFRSDLSRMKTQYKMQYNYCISPQNHCFNMKFNGSFFICAIFTNLNFFQIFCDFTLTFALSRSLQVRGIFFEPLWTLKIEYSGSWKHQFNTSRVVSTPWPLEKRAIKLYCKYWVVLNTAMTVETYNGTPAQSQVERDKTVATNESSSEKKEGWNSRGAKETTLPFSFFP